MNFRTDLALETREMIPEPQIEGVSSKEEQAGSLAISTIEITSPAGAERMKRAMGTYVTITCPPFSDSTEVDEAEIEEIAQRIREMLPQDARLALVVGLGNRGITPDALGPQVIEKTLATRHISEEIKRSVGLEHLRAVAALSPGVLGQTGVETAEIVNSVVKEIRPDAVIVIDALASKSLDRLGTTIQLSDTGISPGSGVMNRRKELSEGSLGVPVLAIGVPTVVDALTLAQDIVGEVDTTVQEKVEPRGAAMMVTPREIDLIIGRSSRVVSLAINRALQPEMSLEDIQMLVS